ncbi:class I SAM-dependent methyltransferase [Desulfobacterota bacterium M19]
MSETISVEPDWLPLENMATAYWHSEVLFAALELELFARLEEETALDVITVAANCRASELERLLLALEVLGLVENRDGKWYNSKSACRYLVPGRKSYLGDFLLYRRYLQGSWGKLSAKVSRQQHQASFLSPDDDYEKRTLYYVRAMDALARLNAPGIVEILADFGWQGPILDIGGGSGALSRALLEGAADGRALLYELPEVLRAAADLYPRPEDWRGMETISGDFRQQEFNESFGLVLLGNFLHIYDRREAGVLLEKAAGLTAPGGLLLIHDYFPDAGGRASAVKGRLYDINMMVNTCNGRCHLSSELAALLPDDFAPAITHDLPGDSSIFISRRRVQ